MKNRCEDMTLRFKILKVLSSKPRFVREICCLVNGKPYDYCLNVDGKGGRCVYWFRRPKDERQRIRLVKPDCKYDPRYVIRVINQLAKEGKVVKIVTYRLDPYSRWGMDKYTIVKLKKSLNTTVSNTCVGGGVCE